MNSVQQMVRKNEVIEVPSIWCGYIAAQLQYAAVSEVLQGGVQAEQSAQNGSLSAVQRSLGPTFQAALKVRAVHDLSALILRPRPWWATHLSNWPEARVALRQAVACQQSHQSLLLTYPGGLM